MPTIIFARKSTKIKLKHFQKCIDELLTFSGKKRAILEISLVGQAEIRKLNKKFRRKDRITDVLSFPQDSRPPARGGPWLWGEIVIAVPVARAQAQEAGRRALDQIIRLAVHGLAHLAGLDHEKSAAEARRFQGLERKWLRRLRQKGWMRWDGSLSF
jgi:probable rRNA maturation factor